MKGITKEIDLLPEVSLERYMSDGSGNDSSLGNLHMMWSPYSYEACNCFYTNICTDAKQKEGKDTSGSSKHTLVAVKMEVLG